MMRRLSSGPGLRPCWLLLLVLSVLVFPRGSVPAAAAELPRDESWIEMRSAHFHLLSNAGERKTEEIALDLERFRALLERLRPGSRLQAPVPSRVVVFKNERSFRPYKAWRGGGGKNLLGYFLADQFGNFIAMNAFPKQGSSLPVVYHEFTHFYVRHNFDRLPLWVNEGLAEYYSSIDQVGSDLRIGVAIPRHIRWLRANSFIPMERFLSIDESSAEYNEASKKGGFYAQSWGLVHYLLLGDEAVKERSGEFLALLDAGESASSACQQAFGFPLEELTARLRRYVNGAQFQALVMDAALLAPPTSVRTRTLSRAEVLTRLGDLIAFSRENAADAEAHYRAALKVDPRHADAWAGLGNLARLAGRYGSAVESLEKAVRLGSNNALPFVWYADLLMGWTDPASQRTGGRARARALLERAEALDPDFVEIQAMLGTAILDGSPEADAATGIASLERAVEVFPTRLELAYNLTIAYLQADDVPAARRIFDRHLRDRGRPKLEALAQEAIERDDLIRRSNEASMARDLDRASELLKEAIAITTDSDLTMQLTGQLAKLEAAAAFNRQVDRYNRAVELANAGRLEEANTLLEELAGEVEDLQLREQIGRLLSRLR